MRLSFLVLDPKHFLLILRINETNRDIPFCYKLVLLTTPGAATYEHYQDNGEDYKYQEGEYNLYRFNKSKDGRLDTELVHEGYEQYKTIEIKAL